ncbi:aldehyde dehydrogenase family protein [Paracoccus sp. SCSIO 75233]|uniref:aldehyde dehydrogenase family protein n=1 Tax=Paracoccus sp. SCSIO 75233 TaxID=3017782 RepID=UPI0022F05B87|nr:aldehyde dehydrogenase family protein [Paracoccus sp. SCSIO 75233]WBU53062.1 aldehyde dehydrogenase family protein [Paracoccus sp. SCSIO 75233]
MWINGVARDARNDEVIERETPAAKGVVTIAPRGTAEDAEDAIAAAEAQFLSGEWAESYGGDKAKILAGVAACIRRDAEELAYLETLETGKPLKASLGEVEGSADLWEYASGLAPTLHGDSYSNLGPDRMGMILRQPIGVVSIITPWNFPLLIASERIPFALAAGCSTVVKPSEFTSATTLRLGEYLKECGLPDGACNIVSGHGHDIGQVMIEHPSVRMVSFTGSPRVGKIVMHAAAETTKKLSLELGGKSPSVVFADCDMEAAIDGVLKGSNFNAGQCCIAGSRLIVEDKIADQFLEKLIVRAQDLKVGDPFDPQTAIGAIVNEAQFDQIDRYVSAARDSGASILMGGEGDTSNGLFYQPTIIANAPSDSPIAQEEIFGPVLSVFRFKTIQEAIKLANSTNFGLAAYIWTNDLNTALSCGRRIEGGRVWVNAALQGIPEMPLGGYRGSGIGRETGRFGVDEYCEMKSLQINHMPQAERWVTTG